MFSSLPNGHIHLNEPLYHSVWIQLKEWSGLIMIMLSTAMQHAKNRKSMEISTTFAGTVG